MKKFGIIILVLGVLLMGIAAFKFVSQKKHGSEEQVLNQPLPFPWLPTSGALLTAIGIIMMGTGSRKKVM